MASNVLPFAVSVNTIPLESVGGMATATINPVAGNTLMQNTLAVAQPSSGLTRSENTAPETKKLFVTRSNFRISWISRLPKGNVRKRTFKEVFNLLYRRPVITLFKYLETAPTLREIAILLSLITRMKFSLVSRI